MTAWTARPADRWRCANCLLEIRHQPTFHVGLAFCCAGCVAGGPCGCSYDDDAPRDAPASEPCAQPHPAIEPRIPELAGVD